MIHYIEPRLATRAIKVLLVGAGGTGSHVLKKLAIFHKSMVELGHPEGLHVTVIDPDVVSKTNVGRQAFYSSDVGLPKAEILVNRCNMQLQTNWDAIPEKFTEHSNVYAVDLVIGCVDNRAGRKAILTALGRKNSLTYYLDFGNRAHDGQVILGQVGLKGVAEREGRVRLPHVGELFPDILDTSLDDADDTPSCSLAEALERQSLLINETMATMGMNLLWELLRYGQIAYHGQFINIKTGRVTPLAVDPEAWKRFGYGIPVAKKKRQKKKAA